MPRAEVGTTKYLNNKLKSKGLQRLRWVRLLPSLLTTPHPLTPIPVLPSLRKANPRRKRLQMPHPIRVSRPPNAPHRRRPAQAHLQLQHRLPARLPHTTAHRARREEGPHQPLLPGVHQRQAARAHERHAVAQLDGIREAFGTRGVVSRGGE